MSSLFFDKLLSRIDKVDPARLHTHMARLRREWRKQETILQSIQEGVVVLDERMCLADANRAAEKLLSFKAESFRGKSMEPFFEGLDFSSLATPPARGASHSWSRIITHELEITYPERRILSVYAVPLEDDDEAPSVLVILRDITAERDREASALEGERQSAVKHPPMCKGGGCSQPGALT